MLIGTFAYVGLKIVFKVDKFFISGLLLYNCQFILSENVSTKSLGKSSFSRSLELLIL